MIGKEIDRLIKIVAKLPSLGPRSARRIVLQLLKKKESTLLPFIEALSVVAQNVKTCEICGNYDTISPCSICCSDKKENDLICVVQDIRDVLAIENTMQYRGVYHVLGGLISPMDGVGPSDLNIDKLVERAQFEISKEIILALSATMEGDTTNFYLFKKLKDSNVSVSVISRGIGIGSEIEYTDEATLGRSIMNRAPFELALTK